MKDSEPSLPGKPGKVDAPEVMPPRGPPSAAWTGHEGHKNPRTKGRKSSEPSRPPPKPHKVNVPEVFPPQDPHFSAALPTPSAKEGPKHRPEVVPPQEPPSLPPLRSTEAYHTGPLPPTGANAATALQDDCTSSPDAARTNHSPHVNATVTHSGSGSGAMTSNQEGHSGEGAGGLGQSSLQSPSGSAAYQSTQNGYITAEGVRVVDDSGWQDEFQRLEQQFEMLRRSQMATAEATEILQEPMSQGQPHGGGGLEEGGGAPAEQAPSATDSNFGTKIKNCATDWRVAAALLISVAGVALAVAAGTGTFGERTNDAITEEIQIEATESMVPTTSSSPQPTQGPFLSSANNTMSETAHNPSLSPGYTPTADPMPPSIPLSTPQPTLKPQPTRGPFLTSPNNTMMTATRNPSSSPTHPPTADPAPPPTSLSTPSPVSKPTPLPTYIPSPQPTKQPTNGPTIPLTHMPTGVPTISNVSSVEKRICDNLPSTCANLSTEGTPQSMALAWLASDSNLEEYKEWRRVQRFVLGVLYHSMEGWEVDNVINWMANPDDECMFSLVDCNALGRVRYISHHGALIGSNIPPDLALLSSSLEELDLSEVDFKGSIPTQIGMLTKLQILNLAENELSGPVPTEMGRLTNLKYLELYRNRLSGQVPTYLGNLTQLEHLELHENDLTGTMPEEVCSLRTPSGTLLDLEADCEEVQCDCCTWCCH